MFGLRAFGAWRSGFLGRRFSQRRYSVGYLVLSELCVGFEYNSYKPWWLVFVGFMAYRA